MNKLDARKIRNECQVLYYHVNDVSKKFLLLFVILFLFALFRCMPLFNNSLCSIPFFDDENKNNDVRRQIQDILFLEVVSTQRWFEKDNKLRQNGNLNHSRDQ
jgi:hypothetical protein